MTESGDNGAAMQKNFQSNVAKTPVPRYRNPVTSGIAQDMLRSEFSSDEYSENNPEPPSMKL